VAVVVAIIVSSLFNLADLGVSVVGQIPGGLPTLQIPHVGLTDFRILLPAALALAVLIFADELLVARVFAKKITTNLTLARS
jgi:MFS superfamily sulfate permease-like transporter